MKLSSFLLTLLALVSQSTAAHAGIVFYQGVSASGNSYDITDYRLADDFLLSGDATIQGIGFWYQAQFQSDLSQVTYAIYTDQSGALGTALQSETLVPTLSVDAVSGQFFADLAITPLALSGATTYWLELHAGATLTDAAGFTISWMAADENATPIALSNTSLNLPDTPVNFDGFNQYSFQLDAAPPVEASVPEPGPALLIAPALLALLARRQYCLRKAR